MSILVPIGYTIFNTYTAANGTYEQLDRGNKSNLREKEVTISEDPVSILVMGVEDYSSNGANGRADSLVVITLDPKDMSMKMVSIPRDSRVDIIGRDKKDKINHAYVFGEEDMTINTVENFLNIPIDYYVTLDFDGFKNIINVIGGVTVDVPFNFWEKSDEGMQERIYFKKGKHTLNGEEALAYVRMRKRDPKGDLGRNERQQQVINAVLEKIISPSTIFKINDIADEIGSNVQTNIKITEAAKMATKMKNFNKSMIERYTITGTDQYIGGIYYFIPDDQNVNEITKELKNHLHK